jgi:hypothetical protein
MTLLLPSYIILAFRKQNLVYIRLHRHDAFNNSLLDVNSENTFFFAYLTTYCNAPLNL